MENNKIINVFKCNKCNKHFPFLEKKIKKRFSIGLSPFNFKIENSIQKKIDLIKNNKDFLLSGLTKFKEEYIKCDFCKAENCISIELFKEQKIKVQINKT